LHRLEKRFARDLNLKAQCTRFLDEYLELGHMKQREDITNKNHIISHIIAYSRERRMIARFA